MTKVSGKQKQSYQAPLNYTTDKEATGTVEIFDTAAPATSEKAEPAAKAKLHLERAKMCSVTSAPVEDITSRLSGGNFGDITVDGSKDTHPNGHRELSQLRELLTKVLDFQTKQLAIDERILQLKENTPQKGADGNAEMSANNVRVMETVIEQKTNEKFRDISIKFEEMTKKLNKSEKRNEQLESELEALKTKMKKSAGGNQRPSMTQHHRIVSRVADLEKKQKQTTELSRNVELLELQSQVQRQVNQLESTAAADYDYLTRKVERLESDVSAQETLVSLHGPRLVAMNGRVEELRNAESRIKMLEMNAEASTADWKREIKNLTEWVWDLGDFEDGLDIKTREWLAELNDRIRVVQRESGHAKYDRVSARKLWSYEDLMATGRERRGD
ncbi:uncharacterized protein MYCFIDRAFT_217129 [Pseudocercospora fijiensis CIRAD86]|uniref:Uncharacterized protein n=1 Tax=Pseudocercospora fijiensis (strain CIRAD86) TaxID=383855 RepID=M2YGG0_PSEFD|nr:uncharacterized protein MYCFIDRAFT_217129 [Pseudocercospora fijiensis CIRAD86]EME76885.1 hypothetical protein MYCFIDRAFT_217129 [Pseudocercospora fijiensis CIRAD86]